MINRVGACFNFFLKNHLFFLWAADILEEYTKTPEIIRKYRGICEDTLQPGIDYTVTKDLLVGLAGFVHLQEINTNWGNEHSEIYSTIESTSVH